VHVEQEGYFDPAATSSVGIDKADTKANVWPWGWDVLRIELANPKATEAGKR
jgi:hypothetical protein